MAVAERRPDKPYPSVLCPFRRRSGVHAPPAGSFEGCREESNTYTSAETVFVAITKAF